MKAAPEACAVSACLPPGAIPVHIRDEGARMPGMHPEERLPTQGLGFRPNFIAKSGKPSMVSNKANVVKQLAAPQAVCPRRACG